MPWTLWEPVSRRRLPQFMQKKSPLYVLLKEDTVWSMERLNRYINTTFWKARGLPKDWVFTTLTVGALCPPARGETPRGGGHGRAGHQAHRRPWRAWAAALKRDLTVWNQTLPASPLP